MSPPIVVEYDGYWENEPGNMQTIFINLNSFNYISIHTVTDKGQIIQYAFHMAGEPYPFVITSDQLALVSKKNLGINVTEPSLTDN